jgi:hypothetical protein
MIDAVVSDHMNPHRSGVARFNELLAERLGVPFVSLREADETAMPLLSFKVSELDADARVTLRAAQPAWSAHELFLHELCGEEIERALIASARRVLAGNDAISADLEGAHGRVETLWTPGLIVEQGRIAPTEVRIFTFGMAHKIRTETFRRLRDLLEAGGRSYSVHVSAANHETATLRDAQLVFEEMRAIFPDRMYFKGHLSDLAIVDELTSATFYAAFFVDGVRATNTSVASAMERGAVVVTNLDDRSPRELRHMDNVIDINQATDLPSDPLVLRRLSVRAMETARARGWDALVTRVRA